MYIDTHAHIYSNNYENVDGIVKNSINNNITKIINCSENLKTAKEIIEISKRYESFVFATVGVHPSYADQFFDETEFENIVLTKPVIAIGEIGLDYHYEIDKEKQKELFKKQLDIAKKYDMPVLIHTREATQDTIKILKKYNLRGIIHCFNGTEEIAKEFIKMGYYLGIGGVVTFKNCKLIELIKKIGIENIVFETDSPFLTPVPHRGEINEPKNVKYVIKFISENLNISEEKIINQANENFKKIFNINY